MGTDKQTINKMINGSRMIIVMELKRIADFLGVNIKEITRIPNTHIGNYIVSKLEGKINSKYARETVKTANILSDKILFHKDVRENGITMDEKWDL